MASPGNLHGASRPTGDLDALARSTRDNLDRLADALRDLSTRSCASADSPTTRQARLLPVVIDGTMLFQAQISTWRTDAGDLDIMHSLPIAPVAALDTTNSPAERREIQTDRGVVVSVAALGDVIASKQWADRPKDREALPELLALELDGDESSG